MKISIIIPVFNAEKYLSKCLDHLINQSYKNIEIICINDGSTDNSLSIIQEFARKDPRILIINQPNAGPARARNQGLLAATGCYIMFCDSDDWYDEQMCERMLQALITRKVDLVCCDCTLTSDLENIGYERGESYCYLNQFGIYQLTYQNMLQVHSLIWNKIFKKSIIDRYKISFPDGFEHDDASFVEQYISCIQYLYGLDEKLYYHSVRKNSIMHNMYGNDDKIMQSLSTIEYDFKFIKNNNLLNSRNYYYITHLLFYRIKWVLMTVNLPDNKMTALNLTQKILIDFDLDSYPEDNYIDILKKIKQKDYSTFFEIQDEPTSSAIQDKSTLPLKKNKLFKKITAFLKSYLLWPYYIYKIYKKIK